MIKIYHNPRCRKSREGLAIVEASGQDYEIVNYLDAPPTPTELKSILSKLDMTPLELVRKNEGIWKSEFKGQELSEESIIQALCKYPKLIERPIVIKGANAVIGRPAENIKDLI